MAFNPIKFATRQMPGKTGVSLTVSVGSYSIDMGSLSQQMGSELFIPQSMTVDGSGLNVGQYVTVALPSINWTHLVPGSFIKTFHLPPIEGGSVITVTPSDGASSIPVMLFDYLLRPDSSAAAPSQGVVSAASDNQALTSAGTVALVPAGVNGVLSDLSIEFCGGQGPSASSGQAIIKIEDGNSNIISIARVSFASGSVNYPPSLILNLSHAEIDFFNGLNSVVSLTGGAFALGSVNINAIYRT